MSLFGNTEVLHAGHDHDSGAVRLEKDEAEAEDVADDVAADKSARQRLGVAWRVITSRTFAAETSAPNKSAGHSEATTGR